MVQTGDALPMSNRVALYVTCLVDQVWPAVGEAAVTLLRRLGQDVVFDPRAVCCGQPAYNTGYRQEAGEWRRGWRRRWWW